MSILVNHCYHWISFHLVNNLLEKGYSVTGINDKAGELNEHLAMFLGRNSSFTEGSDSDLTNEFQTIFMFGADDKFNHIQTDRLFHLGKTEQLQRTSHQDKKVIIELPLLFGEWMPMNEKGMYYQNQYIAFDSTYFLNHAISVHDFCELLTNWIDSSELPPLITLQSGNFRENEGVTLENVVYFHDNIPINKKLAHLLTHYEKFNEFYESNK